jgi:hypothetical protein
MFLGVSLPGFFRVVSGMDSVAPRRMSMVRGFLVLSTIMMLRRFAVMPGGMRMMF